MDLTPSNQLILLLLELNPKLLVLKKGWLNENVIGNVKLPTVIH